MNKEVPNGGPTLPTRMARLVPSGQWVQLFLIAGCGQWRSIRKLSLPSAPTQD